LLRQDQVEQANAALAQHPLVRQPRALLLLPVRRPQLLLKGAVQRLLRLPGGQEAQLQSI
jgi:hypothetical protein